MTINASAGADFDGLTAGLSVSQSNTTSIGFQTSKETDASFATTASCFLIHNQNERDLDGIEIYYDKIFSTFMFRRVLARHRPGLGLCAGAVRGRVFDVDGLPLRRLPVTVTDSERHVHRRPRRWRASTLFSNLCPGRYTLTAGDRSFPVVVGESATPIVPARLDLDHVRRVLDLSTAPVWEVGEALGLSSEAVQLVGANLPSSATCARWPGSSAPMNGSAQRWTERNVLSWTKARRPPRARASGPKS